MKKLVTLAVCSMSFGLLGLSAIAAPVTKAPVTHKAVVKPAAAVTCPACQKMGMKMPMTSKKTKVNTRAVKVNGKTMYCCTKCSMKTMTTRKAPTKKK